MLSSLTCVLSGLSEHSFLDLFKREKIFQRWASENLHEEALKAIFVKKHKNHLVSTPDEAERVSPIAPKLKLSSALLAPLFPSPIDTQLRQETGVSKRLRLIGFED